MACYFDPINKIISTDKCLIISPFDNDATKVFMGYVLGLYQSLLGEQKNRYRADPSILVSNCLLIAGAQLITLEDYLGAGKSLSEVSCLANGNLPPALEPDRELHSIWFEAGIYEYLVDEASLASR